jgi:hypothetical protein
MVFEKPVSTAPLKVSTFDQVYMMVFFVPVTFLVVAFNPLIHLVRIFQR